MIRELGIGRLNRLEEIVNTINENQVKEIVVEESRSNSCSLLPDSLKIIIGYITYKFFIADLDERNHRDNYDRIMEILNKRDDIKIKRT